MILILSSRGVCTRACVMNQQFPSAIIILRRSIDIRVEGLETGSINTASRADSSMFLVLRPLIIFEMLYILVKQTWIWKNEYSILVDNILVTQNNILVTKQTHAMRLGTCGNGCQ